MNQSDRLEITKCVQDAQAAISIGSFVEAEKYFRETVKRAQKADHRLYTLALYSLATFYCTQKNYNEAERVYKECILLNEAALFPFHNYLAKLLTDIGVACLAAGRFDDAKKYFNEALGRLDKPDARVELHTMRDRVLLELGKVHYAQQNFEEAEACVKRTVVDSENDLRKGGKNLAGMYEVKLAARQHELSKIFLAQKRYKEAEDLCKRVLDIRERRHEYIRPPVLAEALSALADVHDAHKRDAESKILRQRADDLMETWFEPDQNAFEYELERSIDVCLRGLKDDASLTQIFEMQIATQARQDLFMKRYPHAEQCYRRLLKTKEELVGPHHLDILKDLDVIVMLTLNQQKYAEAEATCLRQLQIAENQLGKNTFVVADKLKWMAAIKVCQKQFLAAEPFFARSFAITQELLYPDSWLFAHCLTTFADLREMQGQEKEADILNQSAYKIFAKGPAANQRFFPSAMFHIPGASYFSLASILEWIGNSEDALSLLIKTLNSREEALGANDQNVGTAACRLGEFYWNLDRLSEAETLYLKALKIFEASPEPQEPDQFCCRSSLRSLLLAMNRYDEAEKYDERLKIPGNQS